MGLLKEAIRDFPIREFFLECENYLLIDGIYPDVTRDVRLILQKLKEKRVAVSGAIRVGPAHIRDVPNWATEEISATLDDNERSCGDT
jgi:hypothetical protein